MKYSRSTVHFRRFEIWIFVGILLVGGTMAGFGAPLWAFYLGVVVTSFAHGLGTFFELRARRRSQGPPLSR